MLIAEEFLLLALDDETGKPLISSQSLEPGLGGALLAELALLGRVDVTPHDAGLTKRGRITIADRTPTGDPVLDGALTKLVDHEGRKVGEVLSGLSTKRHRLTADLQPRLLERLAAAGLVQRREGTVLGFIPRTTWPERDGAAETEVRERVAAAVTQGVSPAERTVALVALLDVTGLLGKVLPASDREDKKAVRARAKALTEGDWAAAAVKASIAEVAAVVASVVTAGAVAATAGSG